MAMASPFSHFKYDDGCMSCAFLFHCMAMNVWCMDFCSPVWRWLYVVWISVRLYGDGCMSYGFLCVWMAMIVWCMDVCSPVWRWLYVVWIFTRAYGDEKMAMEIWIAQLCFKLRLIILCRRNVHNTDSCHWN